LLGAPAEAEGRERALGGVPVARDGEVVCAGVQKGVVLRAVRAIPRQEQGRQIKLLVIGEPCLLGQAKSPGG